MDDDSRRERHQLSEDDDAQRNPFQRDRDAILYTTAFRRLAGVTQVVMPGEGAIYHNRLTHTLEVAQIALRLAEYLRAKAIKEQGEGFIRAHGGLSPDAVEAAALAHDLGHPPFGHVAEKTLNRLIVAKGILDGYEGNAQSFRIVTKLVIRREREEFHGLNLTRAALNATLKYPWPQASPDGVKQAEAKWGVYQSEAAQFDFARKGLPEDRARRKTLEAEIMDWADDIAYSIHDTEDFYRAGLIPLDRIVTVEGEAERFTENVFSRWLQIGKECDDATRSRLAEAFLRVVNIVPIDKPYHATISQRANLRQFTSKLIGRYILATRLADDPASPEHLVIDQSLRDEITMLKELTWQYVIKGSALAAQQHGYKQIIIKLFDVFSEAASSDDPSNWWVLPQSACEMMESLRERHQKAIPDADRFRVVADAIAGMTDQQALLMYQRFMGISSGSVLDIIVG